MMTDTVAATPVAPVRKSIIVEASPTRAFQVFTDGIDAWWPRSHHIGKVPMTRAVIEGRAGGRLYMEQEDGSECDWGTVLVWEPPHRVVFSWSITGDWQYEPDLDKSSEVEVRFSPEPGEKTRVDLEHRHLERHGAGASSMRSAIDAPDGWGGVLQRFAAVIQPSAS